MTPEERIAALELRLALLETDYASLCATITTFFAEQQAERQKSDVDNQRTFKLAEENNAMLREIAARKRDDEADWWKSGDGENSDA